MKDWNRPLKLLKKKANHLKTKVKTSIHVIYKIVCLFECSCRMLLNRIVWVECFFFSIGIRFHFIVAFNVVLLSKYI